MNVTIMRDSENGQMISIWQNLFSQVRRRIITNVNFKITVLWCRVTYVCTNFSEEPATSIFRLKQQFVVPSYQITRQHNDINIEWIFSHLLYSFSYNIYFCVTLASPFVTEKYVSFWVASASDLVLRGLQSEPLPSAWIIIPVCVGVNLSFYVF
jgi:hypothetical protein